MCKEKCKGSCACNIVTKILVIIGGVNWGLVGLGMLFGDRNWNVVHLIFGSIPWLSAVIYLLVGVAALSMIFGCRCKKCAECCCQPEASKEVPQMPQ